MDAMALWKMTAGYYGDLKDYYVLADSESDARRKVERVVKREIHPEGGIICGSEEKLMVCGWDVFSREIIKEGVEDAWF